MTGRYARLSSKSEKQQSYGIRLNIIKAVQDFIFQSNFCIKSHNGTLVEHIKTDIQTIRALVLNFMAKDQMTNPSQQTIADKIGVKKAETVGKSLKRLEEAGFIYKIRRYQLIDTGERNAQGEVIERPENRSLGYCLTPNLISRIKEALKKGYNFLSPISLVDKLKKIIFSKTRQIKTYRNGKIETKYTKPQEALEAKKQHILSKAKAYCDQKINAIINKPCETKLDHTLKEMAELFKNERQALPHTEPIKDG